MSNPLSGMVMGWSGLSSNVVNSVAAPGSLARGKGIMNDVLTLRIPTSDKMAATVKGSTNYSVSAEWNGSTVSSYSCSCPDRRPGACKHVCAALLWIMQAQSPGAAVSVPAAAVTAKPTVAARPAPARVSAPARKRAPARKPVYADSSSSEEEEEDEEEESEMSDIDDEEDDDPDDDEEDEEVTFAPTKSYARKPAPKAASNFSFAPSAMASADLSTFNAPAFPTTTTTITSPDLGNGLSSDALSRLEPWRAHCEHAEHLIATMSQTDDRSALNQVSQSLQRHTQTAIQFITATMNLEKQSGSSVPALALGMAQQLTQTLVQGSAMAPSHFKPALELVVSFWDGQSRSSRLSGLGFGAALSVWANSLDNQLSQISARFRTSSENC